MSSMEGGGVDKSFHRFGNEFGMPQSSAYWIRRDSFGNFQLGRRGEEEPMRTLRASAPDAESYRKARLLLYLQNRAERVKKDSGDADTQEKEKLSHAERFVEDSNCYQAAAFVFNPKENDLSSVFAGGFPDAGAVPKMRETLSYDELRKNIFSLRPPVLVSTYNEAIQQRYGGEAGATHHFVILDYDEKVEDFICFEKIRVDEPVQIVNLKQIYAGHSSSLWGLSKI